MPKEWGGRKGRKREINPIYLLPRKDNLHLSNEWPQVEEQLAYTINTSGEEGEGNLYKR